MFLIKVLNKYRINPKLRFKLNSIRLTVYRWVVSFNFHAEAYREPCQTFNSISAGLIRWYSRRGWEEGGKAPLSHPSLMEILYIYISQWWNLARYIQKKKKHLRHPLNSAEFFTWPCQNLLPKISNFQYTGKLR